jgi:hypothetical protein
VFDVWEYKQDLNNFINSRFKPAVERINVQIYDISAYFGIDSVELDINRGTGRSGRQ